MNKLLTKRFKVLYRDNKRKYDRDVLEFADVYTIYGWNDEIHIGGITTNDGSGYWVKSGLMSNDEVFSTPQLDATHVAWFNK